MLVAESLQCGSRRGLVVGCVGVPGFRFVSLTVGWSGYHLTSLTRLFILSWEDKIMRSYSVYEAKTKLSELLRIVKNGAEVIVLERGEPIAKVVPLKAQDELRGRLQVLEEQGLLISAKGHDFPDAIKPVKGGLKRFLEER